MRERGWESQRRRQRSSLCFPYRFTKRLEKIGWWQTELFRSDVTFWQTKSSSPRIVYYESWRHFILRFFVRLFDLYKMRCFISRTESNSGEYQFHPLSRAARRSSSPKIRLLYACARSCLFACARAKTLICLAGWFSGYHFTANVVGRELNIKSGEKL